MKRSQCVSLSSAARACGVSKPTLRRWLKDERIPLRRVKGAESVLQEDLGRCLRQRGLPVPPRLDRWPRILVVEDEADMRTILAGALRSAWEDPEIRTADNGFRAMKILSDFPADLVVTDLLMPGVDGLSLCKAIRDLPELRHTRILAITGVREDYVREAAFDEGAVEFFNKPVDPAELRASALRLIGKTPEPAPAV